MKKIKVSKKFIKRQTLANPYGDIPLKQRLIKSGAIDLRDNHKIEDLGNGYMRILPLDKTKLIK